MTGVNRSTTDGEGLILLLIRTSFAEKKPLLVLAKNKEIKRIYGWRHKGVPIETTAAAAAAKKFPIQSICAN